MSISFNKDEIKNSITDEQIFQFLKEHGGEPEWKGANIVSRTICHNRIEDEASHKLYYYANTKLFKCYTGCEETGGFDIFDLIRKIGKIQDHIEYTLYDAEIVAINAFCLDVAENFSEERKSNRDFEILDKYEKNNLKRNDEKVVNLKFYDPKVLENLPYKRIKPWVDDGITEEVMKSRGIRFDPYNYGVVIPHWDMNFNLLGIRERTLVQEEEKNGKYRPAIINHKMYNHPLGFNLYNLCFSKDNIRRFKTAIIGEGEKFCLGYASYFGVDNDITVACCGSSLIEYQVKLLLALGVEEIVIAFDKQFKEPGDAEYFKWVKKLTAISQKYSKYVTISFMFDKDNNKLGYKESPIDGGKEIFLQMFKERFTL